MIFRIGWSFWVHFPQYFKDFFRISEDSRKFFGFCGFLGIFRIVGGFWVHFSRYFQGFFQFSSSSYSGFTLNFRISEDFQDFSEFSGSIRNFQDRWVHFSQYFQDFFNLLPFLIQDLLEISEFFRISWGFSGSFRGFLGPFSPIFSRIFKGFFHYSSPSRIRILEDYQEFQEFTRIFSNFSNNPSGSLSDVQPSRTAS